MTLAYRVKTGLYLNITNRCHCSCIFCIRKDHDGVGDGENLWLSREPSAQEIIDSIRQQDLSAYGEVVFCGYGEPTERLEVLLDVCRYLKKEAPDMPIRLNTNGLSDLLYNKETAPLLNGYIDVISISLNAPDADRYMEITRPSPTLGTDTFSAMLQFATHCSALDMDVRFSVVDILSTAEIEQCRQLASAMEIPLRVRVKS